jgi:thioredoxin reductase (NADPH)
MAKPALVVVHGEPEVLAALNQALRSRFGADYQILAATTPQAALDTLGRLRQSGKQVALVLANQWLAGITGVELLGRAHALHPTAKRVLLITYGDAAGGTAGLQAIVPGHLRGAQPVGQVHRQSGIAAGAGPDHRLPLVATLP